MKSFHQLIEEKKKAETQPPRPQPPAPRKRIVSLEEYRKLMKIIDNK